MTALVDHDSGEHLFLRPVARHDIVSAGAYVRGDAAPQCADLRAVLAKDRHARRATTLGLDLHFDRARLEIRREMACGPRGDRHRLRALRTASLCL